MLKNIAIVIPAYNEETTIGDVVKGSTRYGQVIVVDDGSTDGTKDIASGNGAMVLSTSAKTGVGYATIMGIEYVIEKNCDIIITLDGDGQHPPEAIPSMIERIREGYDFVFASRTKDNRSMPFVKKLGNRFLTSSFNLIFGGEFTDTQTGFRAFTREAYLKFSLKSNDYSVCSEFAREVIKNDLKYCEIPIQAIYDDHTKSKGTNVITGIKIFFKILGWKILKNDTESK